MTMDEQTIYKAEHDCIADSYDWIGDHATDGAGVHYVIGIHDFAEYLIGVLKAGKEEKNEG